MLGTLSISVCLAGVMFGINCFLLLYFFVLQIRQAEVNKKQFGPYMHIYPLVPTSKHYYWIHVVN